jgi:transposase
LASVQGRSPAEAAGMFAATAQYAREVIHAFNEQGFAALDPKWSGGRPRKFGSVAREIVCRVAKTAPQQLGLPFTTWSLTKLVEHLAGAQRIVASTETVRQILREAGISWQATRCLERQPGSGVRGEDGRHPGALRPGGRRADPRGRAGDLRG